jgi:MFS family permease
VTAAIVAVIGAFFSDRRGQRSPFIIGFMCMIGIGFIICIAAAGRGLPGVVYAGVFIAVVGKQPLPFSPSEVMQHPDRQMTGIYPAFPGNVTWLSNNLAGSYKRATGMAIHIGAGNLAGAMASNFYRAQDAPKYTLGHSLELGFLVAGLTAAVTLRLAYQRINAKREREGTGSLTEEEMSRMGDKAPSYRYTL